MKIIVIIVILQSSTDIKSVVSQNTYSEPRLVLFMSDTDPEAISQRFIVAEKTFLK